MKENKDVTQTIAFQKFFKLIYKEAYEVQSKKSQFEEFGEYSHEDYASGVLDGKTEAFNFITDLITKIEKGEI